MFGKNPIRKAEVLLDGLTLALQEVFYTIQGEGPQSGRPAVFVRLAGCNLACTFCDTEFETGINSRVEVEMIVAQVMKHEHHKLVVLTGGEPLRQNVIPLIDALLNAGVELVQIETAGTLWVPGLGAWIEMGYVQLVCSPKTPGIHPMIERWCLHYKYVISAGEIDENDGLPNRGTQGKTRDIIGRLYRPTPDAGKGHDDPAFSGPLTVWVSPCDAHDMTQNQLNVSTAVWSAMRFGYRLSLQTHKIVNLP